MRRERGQAMTEYTLAITFMVLVLFTPWAGGKAPFLMFIDAFDIYLRSFHSVICLPIP